MRFVVVPSFPCIVMTEKRVSQKGQAFSYYYIEKISTKDKLLPAVGKPETPIIHRETHEYTN